MNHIRNFAIIAHVDHGKSTLADRLLEATDTIPPGQKVEQVLDTNPIERERGITIKLAPVRMLYSLPSHLKSTSHFAFCTLNLIDTPGHVDFSYEVSRSLAACEGALLVVDATQGIQAQTLAYIQLVKERNLTVIPIVNKIDSPLAQVEKTHQQLVATFGFNDEEIINISAKKGINIDQVLKAIIERIPHPEEKNQLKPLRALVFSSIFDKHRGVIVYVRIVDGNISKKNDNQIPLVFMASGAGFLPIELGYFTPEMKPSPTLLNGEVGYIATGLKEIKQAKVGDTITVDKEANKQAAAVAPLPGYKEVKPMVFASIFPATGNDFPKLKAALEKLHLSDSAFTFKPTSSLALGKGFHCGFLGLLHAEVVQERLEREFAVNVLATSPMVEYHIRLSTNEEHCIQSVADFPDAGQIKQIKEPLMLVTIYSPKEYLGSIMKLVQGKRAEFVDLEYLADHLKLVYRVPLSEMAVDFYEPIKSASSGFASFDYEFFSYQEVDAVKLDILIHGRRIDALAQIVVKDQAQKIGRELVERLRKVIPRQQFEIPVQAAIGGKIIARENIKPFRKDVTQKLYGGDRTRKDKLLQKQKRGKKRMKVIGKVEIPQEAFLSLLSYRS